ncbi:hypothetical protein HYX15_04000 [Candidatus Woesearchaeota archaeon]|nr:hypothetical protein [Candidatus Woesearchaeota archaeon]
MSKLKDKFERIKKEHPRIKLEPYNKVYETLKNIGNPKKGATITVLAEKTKFKRSKVDRIIRILKVYRYVKIAEGSNGIPYLCIIDKKDERYWKWGKEQIGSNLDKNYESLLENLDKAKKSDNKLKTEIKSYQNKKKNGKFFKIYNTLVEDVWSNMKDSDLNKLEIGSTAVKYCIGE